MTGKGTDMSLTTTYKVAGMTCGHCENAVREEIGELSGVENVEVSHESGILTVTSDAPLSLEDVAAALDEAGDYTVTPS